VTKGAAAAAAVATTTVAATGAAQSAEGAAPVAAPTGRKRQWEQERHGRRRFGHGRLKEHIE